eukprot:scaffold10527_cov114-Isochrysis_galbana.AAC.2
MGGEVFEGVGVGEGCVEEGEEQGEEAAILVSEGWGLGSKDSGSPQHSYRVQSATTRLPAGRVRAAPQGMVLFT